MSRNRPPQIADIQLQGEPYHQMNMGNSGVPEVVDCNVSLDTLAENTRYDARLPGLIEQSESHLRPLTEGGGYYGLDRSLKHGRDLSFDETFSALAFVASSLNRPLNEHLGGSIQNLGSAETHRLQAVGLLASISTKEAYRHLTPEEVAGMAAATVHLDTVVRTHTGQDAIAFGGMGGDKGYPLGKAGESKLLSLSTLSAIALAVEGPVHKHHSYPNTSKVAGQSAIEAYGARSDFHTAEAFEGVMQDSSLMMSSCHNTRTLHTLSHLLRGETINHVIGPLAFTMSAETRLQGFIGVNEKVHPETVIKALEILDRTNYQQYGNSVVYCGTDITEARPEMFDASTYYNTPEAIERVRLDEIAPPPYISLAAFMVKGEFAGNYELHPSDFYGGKDLARTGLDDLIIPNTREAIIRYNDEALHGRDGAKARYLAMTVGLGIFIREYIERPDALDREGHRVNGDYLREATERGLEILVSGQAGNKLQEYVEVTNQYAGHRG